MTLYHVDFEPVGRRGQCPTDQSLLDCARQLGVDLVNVCGGTGTCGRCKVQILPGHVSEPTSNERRLLTRKELAEGYRLACQTYPLSDCRLRVPPESLTAPQRTQVEGLEVAVHLEPPVRAYPVRLSPPSLADLRADDERLLEVLEQQHQMDGCTMDIAVLRDLSPRLRGRGWQASVAVRGKEIVALSSSSRHPVGLAVDLGTTKIAGYLVDMESGQTLAAQGVMNPQIAYGEDLIARMARAKKSPSQVARLQELAVEALNRLATDLCAEVDAQAGGDRRGGGSR